MSRPVGRVGGDPAPPRVAIAGHRAFDGASATDLYPDADRPLLSAALADTGAEATWMAWDDEDVDWGRFDLVVISSTWDSVDRPQEYVTWARRAARSTTLMNPLPAIEWNIDKTYLRTLASRGIPVVPTDWVVDSERWEPPPYEFVVKPSISAGGRQTARYRPDEAPVAADHIRRLLGCGQTVMVQPYMAGVDTEGEAKLVFIGGELSHAVRVGPLLEVGEGVLDRPWEKVVTLDAMAPTAAQAGAARDVLAAVEAEVARPLLYARVDCVTSPTGQPLLAEVELIDPVLFLRCEAPAAGRFAERIAAQAERSMRRR